jgi:hypothetical protein
MYSIITKIIHIKIKIQVKYEITKCKNVQSCLQTSCSIRHHLLWCSGDPRFRYPSCTLWVIVLNSFSVLTFFERSNSWQCLSGLPGGAHFRASFPTVIPNKAGNRWQNPNMPDSLGVTYVHKHTHITKHSHVQFKSDTSTRVPSKHVLHRADNGIGGLNVPAERRRVIFEIALQICE